MALYRGAQLGSNIAIVGQQPGNRTSSSAQAFVPDLQQILLVPKCHMYWFHRERFVFGGVSWFLQAHKRW